MVIFIDTPALAELPARIGVESARAGLADRTEADFVRGPQFEKSARLASHSKVGVLELMPTADGEWFSFTRVSGRPGNAAAGLLPVTAIGMLAEVATAYPRLGCEMTVLTALRTAAVSAMAACDTGEAPAGAETITTATVDPEDLHGDVARLVH